ncbi:MAG: SRPBCC family protein [Halobacteria archaeon]
MAAGKSSQADREIVITRILHAPRELVWEAWTDPKHTDRWMGPRGFATQTKEMSAKPGGAWRYTMRHTEHGEFQNKITYLEVVKPERLVYDHGADDGGEPHFRVTVTFKDLGGKTELQMRSVFPTAAARDKVVKEYNAIEGGNQTVDRLEEHLARSAMEEFAITRTLDASRDLVWKAFTESERMAKWWGPKGFVVRVSKMDLRPGGTYHFCLSGPNNTEMWGRFVFREIVKLERLVYISSFSDEKGGVTRPPFSEPWPPEILSTFTFEERGGKTAVTIRSVPFRATEEERKTFDAGRKSMTQGWTGTFEKLAGYLAEARS